MVRRLQRESEVVHGENIFQEFRILEVPDASRLPGWVELMGHRIGARIEIMVVFAIR